LQSPRELTRVTTSFPWRPVLAMGVVGVLAAGGAALTFLPAASEARLVIETPTDGSSPASRAVTVTGTAPEGSTVRIYDDNSNAILLGTADVVDGHFSVEVAYGDGAATRQGLYIDSTDGGELLDADTVAITLPALGAGAPVGPEGPSSAAASTPR